MGHFQSNRGCHVFVAYCHILIYILYLVEGYDLMANEFRTELGDDVRFNCSIPSRSSADWQYQRTSDARKVNIFIGNAQGGGGRKSNEYRSRTEYHVEIDIPFGRYDLLISNITKSDEGFYYCSDTSDPDSVVNWKLTVLGEQKIELCSNVAIGHTVNLTFPTVKKDSIHLEHRSIDRNYPLHAFRDGRLVNDYYVLSKRFSFSSYDNSWILIINKAQASDAGSFICTEDNGLGKQYVKELVVIDAVSVVCSANAETCHDEYSVICVANYSGYCPPRLQLTTDGGSQPRNETRIMAANTVSITAIINRTQLPWCQIPTQSYVVNSTCKRPVCKDAETEIDSESNVLVPVVVTVVVVTTAVLVGAIIFILLFLRRRRHKIQRCEEAVVWSPEAKEQEQDYEL